VIASAIGLLTLITVANLSYWRLVRARALRWKLYALRDRLRWQAIEKPSLVGSRMFWTLDESLTNDCAYLEELSLWRLLSAGFFWRHDRAEWKEQFRALTSELAQPGNEEIGRLYTESVNIFVVSLCARHIVLFLVALVTIVGPFVLYRWFENVSKELVFRNAPQRHSNVVSPI